MKPQIVLTLCCTLGVGLLSLKPRPVAAQQVQVQVDLADEHMYNEDSGDTIYIPTSAVRTLNDGSDGRFLWWNEVAWAGTIYTADPPNNITGRVTVWDGSIDPGQQALITYSVIYRRGRDYDPGLAVTRQFADEFVKAYPWNSMLEIQTAGLRVDGQGILNAAAQGNVLTRDWYLGTFNILLTRDSGGTLRSYIGVLPGQSQFLDTRLWVSPGFYPGVDVNGVRVPAYYQF